MQIFISISFIYILYQENAMGTCYKHPKHQFHLSRWGHTEVKTWPPSLSKNKVKWRIVDQTTLHMWKRSEKTCSGSVSPSADWSAWAAGSSSSESCHVLYGDYDRQKHGNWCVINGLIDNCTSIREKKTHQDSVSFTINDALRGHGRRPWRRHGGWRGHIQTHTHTHTHNPPHAHAELPTYTTLCKPTLHTPTLSHTNTLSYCHDSPPCDCVRVLYRDPGTDRLMF